MVQTWDRLEAGIENLRRRLLNGGIDRVGIAANEHAGLVDGGKDVDVAGIVDAAGPNGIDVVCENSIPECGRKWRIPQRDDRSSALTHHLGF